MPHGGYGKGRVAERKPSSSSHRSKAAAGVAKKPKSASLKNQIRSVQRFLRKDLQAEVRETQERKLEALKKQQDLQTRLAVERKVFLRDRKVKFFERRKVERRMRRLEKKLRSSSSSSAQAEEKKIHEEIARLKEDLEYVRFFPKTEKYVSLFFGDDNTDLVERRNGLRKQIKANIVAAAASGKDLEETGSEDDGLADISDDDFFLSGSSSDEADADDELTDISAREQASGKAASGLSSDERNQLIQKQKAARSLIPPLHPQKSTRKNFSTSRNTVKRSNLNSNNRGSSNSQMGQSSNMSSNSDAPKPRRKRRPKKKKQ